MPERFQVPYHIRRFDDLELVVFIERERVGELVFDFIGMDDYDEARGIPDCKDYFDASCQTRKATVWARMRLKADGTLEMGPRMQTERIPEALEQALLLQLPGRVYALAAQLSPEYPFHLSRALLG